MGNLLDDVHSRFLPVVLFTTRTSTHYFFRGNPLFVTRLSELALTVNISILS